MYAQRVRAQRVIAGVSYQPPGARVRRRPTSGGWTGGDPRSCTWPRRGPYRHPRRGGGLQRRSQRSASGCCGYDSTIRPVDLDELFIPADHDELLAVLERSVVASGS
jgi:hypothetical protein